MFVWLKIIPHKPKSKPDPTVRLVSIEDQARFANMQMQNKVIDSCKEFFKNRVHDEENDDVDDDDFDEEEEEKNEVDMFFMRIFVNNSEFRGYYEENHEKLQNTLQGEGSNKNVENLEIGNSRGKIQKDASDSLDRGDDLNVISSGIEFVNVDGNGSVKKEVSNNDYSNGELMACNMSNNSLKEEDANENVERLKISNDEPKSMVKKQCLIQV
ncbi:hypothetical protein PVK06_027787 [Gossypium arboreum]|uniref:Uncharacterized protein n=1 Tax=Gossypium arboreum TaxID=29729 RepID=A0ABR0P1H5_GOSAR|nr:hypothetical protein PVK06_027787 [Gossypium arboreum]